MHVLCFSDRATDGVGPHLFTREELHEIFSDGWRVAAVDRTQFEVNVVDPEPGWIASVTRI